MPFRHFLTCLSVDTNCRPYLRESSGSIMVPATWKRVRDQSSFFTRYCCQNMFWKPQGSLPPRLGPAPGTVLASVVISWINEVLYNPLLFLLAFWYLPISENFQSIFVTRYLKALVVGKKVLSSPPSHIFFSLLVILFTLFCLELIFSGRQAHPPYLLRKRQASHGHQQNMTYQTAIRPNTSS